MTQSPRRFTIKLVLVAGILLVMSGVLMLGIASAQENTPSVDVTAEPAAAETQPVAETPPTVESPTVVAPQETAETPSAADGEAEPSNAYCLLCHSQPGLTWTLPSGETLSLTVDPTILAGSVHGTDNEHGALQCVDCHTEQHFPHAPQTVQTVREYQLERYASCRNCHEDEYTRSQDSVHGAAIRAGTLEAATCVDCHGGHDIQTPDVPRQRISLTCGKCHGAIFEQYRTSVHGSALLEEGNPDVPTCIDCHGVHNISDPTTALFRVRSPQLCAGCHTNAQLMDKYGITTNVLDSYLTDFHGTTVALFEQEDPNVATNKAVCYDCHGVHDIARVDTSNSRVVRENLLTTCKQCHPDATADFPDAWVGHFPPTLESHPLLFVVNLFYSVLIPLVVGGFIFLVLTDVFRRVRGRVRGRTRAGE
ncbi:MAG: cytochrome c3 family protein [Anaerolineae bacterium]